MKIRVYYEDTDLGGVVYHANYLKFCERARSELFFQKGLSPVLKGGHFVARSLEADYIKPARFADELEVETELLSLKRASFTLLQRIFRGDEKLFEMTIKLAYLTHAGEVGRLDEETRRFLQEIIG
jgi:acyl-CoA thioester hydrolase